MTLFSASHRAPAAPASLQNEMLSSSSGECVSPKGAQRATLFRRHPHEPSSKQTAQPICCYFDRVSRLRASRIQADHSMRSVPVQVAHEMMNAGYRCLDVRTQEEYLAGHVKGAVNIPYLVKCGLGMKKNHRFLEEVEAEFGKDAEIIVGCQSGRRSMMAAAELRAANFNGVTDLGGGYVAWKESGLPVEASGRRSQSHSV